MDQIQLVAEGETSAEAVEEVSLAVEAEEVVSEADELEQEAEGAAPQADEPEQEAGEVTLKADEPEQEGAAVALEADESEQEGEEPGSDAEDTAEMGELPVEDWDYKRPRRGQVRPGVILDIREQEIVVDVGDKRDGIVPYSDMQRLGSEEIEELSPGDEVLVFIMRPEDQDGNLLVSLHLAKQERAWHRAQKLHESEEIWESQVIGYNKGGLVVPVDEIRGFVPASQVPGFPSGLNQEERLQRLSEMVGQTLMVQVIEINRRKRRLILSATKAQREWRTMQRERLLEELREGEVRKGRVTSLCSFGAFVDLGGADGLIHLSELSWRRIRHPREVVRAGDEVEVYVLRLDHAKKRIGLSLKRLQPEPWSLVEETYELGQLVEGVVTNVVDFGAFAEIEEGVEGLIHVSELTDGMVSHPKDVVKKGDLLLLRIIRIDARRKRLGLSLKRVLESEWAEWAARLASIEAEKAAAEEAARPPVSEEEEEPTAAEEEVELPAAEEEAEELAVAVEMEAELPAAEEEAEEPAVAVEMEAEPPVAEEEVEEPSVAVEMVAEPPAAEEEAEELAVAVEMEVEPPAAEEEAEEPAVAVEMEVEPPAAEGEAEEPSVAGVAAEEPSPEEPGKTEAGAELPLAGAVEEPAVVEVEGEPPSVEETGEPVAQALEGPEELVAEEIAEAEDTQETDEILESEEARIEDAKLLEAVVVEETEPAVTEA